MKILYVAWKDQKEGAWRTVGRLCYEEKKYIFCYTKGAQATNFIPFGRMTDINAVYTSDKLFPTFENRILGSNRPEFREFLSWLGLDYDTYDPLDVLALTEGKRGTDSLEIFSHPVLDETDTMRMDFFVHGSNFAKSWRESLELIQKDTPLFLCPDPQNSKDKDAVLLRTDDPISLIGYCPRYLAKDFLRILGEYGENISVSVKQVNREAPDRYKVLCTMTVKCAGDIRLFSGSDFLPLAKEASALCPHGQKAGMPCEAC